MLVAGITHCLALTLCLQVQPPKAPDSHSKTAAFISKPGLVFVQDGVTFTAFKLDKVYNGADVGVASIVVWDYADPSVKLKAVRLRVKDVFEGSTPNFYIDYDELGDLQRFFKVFEAESAAFKPAKDIFRRVEFQSRGGVSFIMEAQDNKRDLSIGFLGTEIYLYLQNRGQMVASLDSAKKWLDEYPEN